MVSKVLKSLAFSLLGIMALDSLAFAEMHLPPVKPGVPGKNRGDIIAPMLDEQVAAWCDFGKQIVVTRTNILCSYVGDRTPPPATALLKRPVLKVKKVAQFIPKELKGTPYEMTEYGDEA